MKLNNTGGAPNVCSVYVKGKQKNDMLGLHRSSVVEHLPRMHEAGVQSPYCQKNKNKNYFLGWGNGSVDKSTCWVQIHHQMWWCVFIILVFFREKGGRGRGVPGCSLRSHTTLAVVESTRPGLKEGGGQDWHSKTTCPPHAYLEMCASALTHMNTLAHTISHTLAHYVG